MYDLIISNTIPNIPKIAHWNNPLITQCILLRFLTLIKPNGVEYDTMSMMCSVNEKSENGGYRTIDNGTCPIPHPLTSRGEVIIDKRRLNSIFVFPFWTAKRQQMHYIRSCICGRRRPSQKL